MTKHTKSSHASTNRRSFLRQGAMLGGGTISAGLLGAGFFSTNSAYAKGMEPRNVTKGDVAILRFLAAAEILETDLWQQYNELGGIPDREVPGGSGNQPYITALKALDMDMDQYIHDNTEDEMSHFTFINAYLASKGADPVDLERFRTLQGSQATGAQKDKRRLTNLMQLTVDTSWWTRYRSRTQNPDVNPNFEFAQAVPGLSSGKFPAIPRNDNDLIGSTDKKPSDHLQAIANTAGFHFAFIEQGGTSLYPSLAQRVTHPEVLRILLSIGPTETQHFQTWQDKAGNAPAVKDPTNGLTFPDLNSPPFGGEDFQTNLIMPEPTVFFSRKFPVCSIIRPTETRGAAMGAVKSLTADGLFIGQSQEFFNVLHDLAEQADEAQRS